MFDTSSFRIRYKAPVEKPLLIAAGPIVILVVLATALWSRFVAPISIGPWISSDLLGLLLPIAALAALALVVERAFGADEGYPWRRSIAATGAGVVGGTLLVGAWGKLLDPIAFAQTLRLEGITSWLGSGWYPETVPALLVIAIEVVLGSLLVLGVRYRVTLVTTGLLVAFFLFLTGRSWWRDLHGIVVGDAASCGCFGNLLDRSPREAFFQDAVLLVPGLLLATLALPQRHTLGRRVAIAWMITALAVALGWFAPGLPIDDIATRLAPGRTGRLRSAPAVARSGSACRLSSPSSGKAAIWWCCSISNADGMDAEVESLNRYAQSPTRARDCGWSLPPPRSRTARSSGSTGPPSRSVRRHPRCCARSIARCRGRSWSGTAR